YYGIVGEIANELLVLRGNDHTRTDLNIGRCGFFMLTDQSIGVFMRNVRKVSSSLKSNNLKEDRYVKRRN
ncbi:hypothetical protein ACRW1F_26245, partial [Escherichia coli]